MDLQKATNFRKRFQLWLHFLLQIYRVKFYPVLPTVSDWNSVLVRVIFTFLLHQVALDYLYIWRTAGPISCDPPCSWTPWSRRPDFGRNCPTQCRVSSHFATGSKWQSTRQFAWKRWTFSLYPFEKTSIYAKRNCNDCIWILQPSRTIGPESIHGPSGCKVGFLTSADDLPFSRATANLVPWKFSGTIEHEESKIIQQTIMNSFLKRKYHEPRSRLKETATNCGKSAVLLTEWSNLPLR